MHSDFKQLQKKKTKTSNFLFQQLAPLPRSLEFIFFPCFVFRSLLAGCSRGLFLPRGLFVVFPCGGLFFGPSVECFVVLVDPSPLVPLSEFCDSFPPVLFCTTNSRFSQIATLSPPPIPTLPLSYRVCCAITLAWSCGGLYVVTFFLPVPIPLAFPGGECRSPHSRFLPH